MHFINKEEVFLATNGGLNIIHDLYPQSIGCEQSTNKKFKTRNSEKTASANLKLASDGVWIVTDFGDASRKPMNAIQCYAFEKGLDFGEAIKEIAARYNILSTEEQAKIIRADYKETEASPDEAEGTYSWDIKNSFSDFELETIFSKNTLKYVGWFTDDQDKKQKAYAKLAAVLKEYRWHSLISYSRVSNRKKNTFSSTDSYPIFLIDEGKFQKIYQPLSPKKEYRFFYAGDKPKSYIHGFAQLENAFKSNKKRIEEEATEEEIASAGDEGEDLDVPKKKPTDPRLPEAILCAGGSDALNVAVFGYRVLWLNSESAIISDYEYNQIMKFVVKLYQSQDADTTGLACAHRNAMKFLDLYNIELPEELAKYRDRRGNPCKDIRDYLNHFNYKDFEGLLENAMTYRFWNKRPKYAGRGESKAFVGYEYEFDNVLCYNFLAKNGYYRMRDGDKKTSFIYIRIVGNTVQFQTVNDIKDFIHQFLKERNFDRALRNKMYNTPGLNETSLSNLPIIDIDFKDADVNSQILFFKNKTVKVTKDEIVDYRPGILPNLSWEEDILEHHFELLPAPFEISKDEFGEYDIKINNNDCLFTKYLIQTSRMHWRKELEGDAFEALSEKEKEDYLKNNHAVIDGPLLNDDEKSEQKRHLVNKLFTLGYLLHRYRDRSRSWFAYGMDGKISDDGQSHGGSGKSLFFDLAIRHVLKNTFRLPARNPKVAEDPHKYDGLTEHHRYIIIDDAHELLRLDIFYTDVTGDVSVNPKGKQPYTIPFEKAPKIAITTNYSPKNLGPSTERRMLYSVFSDYYHYQGQTTDYKESRDPKTDLGCQLFTDFDKKQWNYFYNLCIYSLKFYLSTEDKISPAMDNVNKRNLLAEMGTNFHDWALTYFSEDSNNIDRELVREKVYQEYLNLNPAKPSPQGFIRRLKAFCKYYGYVLNPTELLNTSSGKIIKKVDEEYFDKRDNVWRTIAGSKKAKELIYIQTVEELNPEPKVMEDEGNLV